MGLGPDEEMRDDDRDRRMCGGCAVCRVETEPQRIDRPAQTNVGHELLLIELSHLAYSTKIGMDFVTILRTKPIPIMNERPFSNSGPGPNRPIGPGSGLVVYASR